MIDPRVASGLRDLPPSVMIPRERMLAAFPRDVRLVRLRADRDPAHRAEGGPDRQRGGLGRGPPADLRRDEQRGDARRAGPAVRPDGPPGPVRRQAHRRAGRAVQAVRDRLGLPRRAAGEGAVPRVHAVRLRHDRHRERAGRRRDRPGDPRGALRRPASPISRSPSTTARSSTVCSTSLGLPGQSGPVLRRSTSSPRSAAQACSPSCSVRPTTGGAGPHRRSGLRVLDFVETGRGWHRGASGGRDAAGAEPQAAEGIANLRTVLDLLEAAGVPSDRIAIDLGLARGLDYYTGIVFETTSRDRRQFGSIASGGRYDNLASLFTSRRLPGVGASIGLDRLLALMAEAGWLNRLRRPPRSSSPISREPIPIVPFQFAARLRAPGSARRSIPSRSRSASRWVTARIAGTSWQ